VQDSSGPSCLNQGGTSGGQVGVCVKAEIGIRFQAPSSTGDENGKEKMGAQEFSGSDREPGNYILGLGYQKRYTNNLRSQP